MTSKVFLLPLCVLIVLFGTSLAQDKCKQPYSDATNWATTLYDYVVLYNISSSKPTQTCYDILESYQSVTKDELTFVYSIGGVVTKRKAKLTLNADTKLISIIFDDAPGQVVDVGVELSANGVIALYICQGSQQDILVGYINTKDMTKEVDDFAKGLNANSADFKISRDGCVPPTP